MSSPTSRSLDRLRAEGWTADVVERNFRIPGGRSFKRDLFGFCDIVAVKPGHTLAVQTTSGSNAAARVVKTLGCEGFAAAVNAGWRVEVHGWAKRGARGKRKTWTCRVDVLAAGREALPAPAGMDALYVPQPLRCTAMDAMPTCTSTPVPGTSLCWAHGGDLVAAAMRTNAVPARVSDASPADDARRRGRGSEEHP